MKTTFDLSTLGLPDGEHSVTVKARAKGYADSADSAAVTYKVATATASTLILNNTGNFYLGYQVDDSSGWGQSLYPGESVEITGIKSFVSCSAGISFEQSSSIFTDCEVVWSGSDFCKIYPKGENATANLYSYD